MRLRTSQLTFALESLLSDDFVTVCSIGELELNKNGIYVVNTDNYKGRHWTALFVTDATVEFFESFGREPRFIQNGLLFMQCIQKTKKTLVVTSKLFQDKLSQVCGWYCLAYAYIRVKLSSVEKFYDLFTNDFKRNDRFVVFLVKKLYHM